MDKELKKIKNKVLDDFIKILKKSNNASRFDKVFSYEEVYNVVSDNMN